MSYEFKVRCGKCNKVFNNDLPADHYNAFTCYICRECGSHGCFYDSTEKYVCTGTLLKPWTWFDGYYVNKKGEIIND